VKKRFTCSGIVAAVLLVAIATAMVCGLRNSYGASHLRLKTSDSGPTTDLETSHGPIVSLHGTAPKVSKSLYVGAPKAARVATTARALQATKSPAGSPLNDNCAQAISLTINGNRVQGSTVKATTESQVDDVSYVFVGNGRRVRVSTCFPDTTTAHNFVLLNGGCTSPYYSGSTSLSDDQCLGNVNAASFEFDSVNGRSYPILVYPRSPGVQGQFAIRVSDYVNPVNDYCSQAISMNVNGNPVQGSTVNATYENQVSDVSYVFVGNGRRVRVSTCFPGTTTAHNFVLLNGGCTSPYYSGSNALSDGQCLDNTNAASFEFDSVDERSYPILVYPRNTGVEGQFAIRVSDYVNPVNDYCSQAISIRINGRPERGSTVNATYENQVSDVSYVFVGNGRRVRVSTCFPDTTTAHNFVLLNGGCTSPYYSGSNALSDDQCLDNTNAASFEFDTVNGRSYPILVYPRSSGVQGQFAIRVSDYVNPVNDYCSQAISLRINGRPVRGSTVNATYENQVSDVSYVFVGNGRRVRVSTCFPDTTTAHNFVLLNGGCTSPYYSGSNSLSAPKCTGNIGDTAASFEFDTVNGRSYPILVYPRSPGMEGQFAIRVSDYVNPVNDYCTQAISLKINGAPIQGSTVHATDENQVDDVIYVFVGNGQRVRVSTCFPYTTTAHNFVLLNGGCTSPYYSGSNSLSAPNCTNLKGETAASFEFDTVDALSYPILVYPRVPGAWGHFAIQVTAV
jgi:hypothetical protein